MNKMRFVGSAAKWLGAAIGVASTSYVAYADVTWLRYGRPTRPASKEDTDWLLDRFMPKYDVREGHHVRVAAPAETTLSAAAEMDLQKAAFVRAIFRLRELILRAKTDKKARSKGLLAELKSTGWGVLAEVPGREIVLGTVTQPWIADVVFHPVSPDGYAAFNEPCYVKIVCTLRVDPISATESVFRTETRVEPTDPIAREKFRKYWSLVFPGVVLIRLMSLKSLKAEAERRARKVAERDIAC